MGISGISSIPAVITEEEEDHEGDEEGHPNEDEHPYDHEEDDEYAKRDL